jgi:opacity protein-like surface antigen
MRVAVRRTLQVATVLLLGLGIGFASTPAQAQVELKPGIRVGVTAAGLGGDEEEFVDGFGQALLVSPNVTSVELETKARTGFTAGGFVVVDFVGPFAIQPEFRYIQRGYRIDFELSNGIQTATVEGTLKFDYIDIPVLARYDIPAPGFTPHLLAGPTLGFNVNSEFEADGPAGTNTEDLSDGTSSTDFGLEFGAGVGFGLGGSTLSVDLRYGIGLSDINEESGDISLQNRAFMITAGFAF